MSEQGRRCDCGKIAGDAYVCKDCGAEARKHLRTIAELSAHADDKRARVSAIDYSRGPARPRETPLPFDPRVTKVMTPIVSGLQGTHNIVCEGRGWHLAVARPAGVSEVCRWLVAHVDWLRTTPEGPEELAFIEAAASNLTRLFDRPPDRLYLGRCEAVTATDDDGKETTCEAHVYVEHTKSLAPETRCGRCGATINVHERRDEFQEAVKGYQATMRELVTLAPMFLESGVSRRTLHEWSRRGLLQQKGQRLELDKEGRRRKVPTYRIGELGEARAAWDRILEERRGQRQRATA